MADVACTQELLVVVVDKLLLGGIIGIFGFFANRILERYKTDQALREDVAKKRFESLEPFWEEITGIRDEVTTVFLNSMGTMGLNIKHADFLQPFDDLIEKIAKVHKNIGTKRFWLGKQLWVKHDDHMHNLSKLVSDLKKEMSDLHGGARLDKYRLEELKKRIVDENESRLYIEDVIRFS